MFSKHLVLLMLSGILCLALPVSAQDEGLIQTTSSPPPTSANYFTIEDSSTDAGHFVSPLQLLEEGLQGVVPTSRVHELLQWIRHSGSPALPAEPYNRRKHFGTWVNDPTDKTCFNTRAKVLMRDAEGDVTFNDNNHCMVVAGKWQDPYTGTVKTTADQLQIDHVVPLKHAYLAGASKWTSVKRCLYANYLGNGFHLLSVDGLENMRKGDSAPDQYLPPNSRFVCDYIQNWLKIKLIWSMTITATEGKAISEAVQQYSCQASELIMTEAQLAEQRARTHDLQEICEKQLSTKN